MNVDLAKRGLPSMGMRIGVHTGEVIIGNVGSEKRQDYTIIGDTVNLSSRLEGVNKYYGTKVIVSGAALAQAGGLFFTRELGRILVKGKTEPVAIHELLGENGGVDNSESPEKLRRSYGEGLAAFYGGDFATAGKIFRSARTEFGDTASGFMQEQCDIMKGRQVPAGWYGEVEMTGK